MAVDDPVTVTVTFALLRRSLDEFTFFTKDRNDIIVFVLASSIPAA